DDKTASVRILLSVSILERDAALDNVLLWRPLHGVQLNPTRPRVRGTAAVVSGDALPHSDPARTVHRKTGATVTLANAIDVLDVTVRVGRTFTGPTVGKAAIPVARHDANEAQVLSGIRRHPARPFTVLVVYQRLARTLDDWQSALIRLEGDPRVGRAGGFRVQRLVVDAIHQDHGVARHRQQCASTQRAGRSTGALFPQPYGSRIVRSCM